MKKINLNILLLIIGLSTISFAAGRSDKTNNDIAFNNSDLTGTELDYYFVEPEVVANDSLRENRVEKVWTSDGVLYYCEVVVKNTDSPIILEVYNMLAKPVILVYKGEPKSNLYQFDASGLPNGPYFCVLQGQGFRDTYKFTVNR